MLLSSGRATPLLTWVILFLLALPLPAVSASGPRSPPHLPPTFEVSSSAVPATLALSSSSYTLPPSFWGTTISAEARLLPDEAAMMNATRSHVLVWPGANAGDRVNMLNDTIITQNGTSLTWKAPPTNETQFIHLCRAMSCEAILQVPGEIDDPSLAAAVVNYTEKNLGFTPAYWEIGNEPELWRYWRVPWSSWNVPPQNGSAIITPGEYAWMVHNYIAVLRTADPNIRILGIAGTGRPQPPVLTPLSAWINATVMVNGANLSGIAFHVYTAGVYGAHTVGQFYAFDNGPYSVFGRVSDARSSISNEINATCPGCPIPPVFLTELGSALSHFYFANLSRGFAGGLSMAASEVEGMDLDLPTLDVFASVFNTSNAWFALNGTPRPDFAVYGQFLSGLGSDVFPATLTPPSGPPYNGTNTSLGANLYAVATEDPSDHGRSDLLLVNLNTTTNVSLAPALPGIPATSRVLLREWSARAVYSPLNSTWWVAPLTAAPVVSVLPGGLPSSWTLPPQTIAEFESYPSAGAALSFNETGLPSAERWYLALNGRTEETPETNLTVILPTGTASVAPVALPLPFGSFRPNPLERMEPFPPSSVTVGSTTQNFLVPFATQWNISTSVGPPGSGWTTPRVGWANASSVVTLEEVPASGFVPGGWTGVGTGSYTGLSSQATLVVKGAIQETALFLHGFPVTFSETGLATGTPWSLSIGGATSSSTSSSLVVLEANGTFALQVGTPSGYTLFSAPSTLTVNGGPVSVSIVFAPVVATYSVRWLSVGLPGGTSWFLLLNGERWNASFGTILAPLANGSYAGWVSNAGDFHPSNRSFTIEVLGGPLNLTVTFVENTYPVLVGASGLPPGASWSLQVVGVGAFTCSSTCTFPLPNGTFAWLLTPPSGYAPDSDHGSLTVRGTPTYLNVTFQPPPAAPSFWGQPVGWTVMALLGGGAALVLGVLLVRWRGRPKGPERLPWDEGERGSGTRSPGPRSPP